MVCIVLSRTSDVVMGYTAPMNVVCGYPSCRLGGGGARWGRERLRAGLTGSRWRAHHARGMQLRLSPWRTNQRDEQKAEGSGRVGVVSRYDGAMHSQEFQISRPDNVVLMSVCDRGMRSPPCVRVCDRKPARFPTRSTPSSCRARILGGTWPADVAVAVQSDSQSCVSRTAPLYESRLLPAAHLCKYVKGPNVPAQLPKRAVRQRHHLVELRRLAVNIRPTYTTFLISADLMESGDSRIFGANLHVRPPPRAVGGRRRCTPNALRGMPRACVPSPPSVACLSPSVRSAGSIARPIPLHGMPSRPAALQRHGPAAL